MTALKGALSGSLEALMLGLMRSTTQYDAFELKNSMKVQSGRDDSPTVPGSATTSQTFSNGFFLGSGDGRGGAHRARLFQEQ